MNSGLLFPGHVQEFEGVEDDCDLLPLSEFKLGVHQMHKRAEGVAAKLPG